MLRALFVIAIIGYGCAKSVKGPFYALLFYLWIAYFRPEYWLWSDFFSQLNLSLIIGCVVVVSLLIAPGERLRFGAGPLLMLLFLGQSAVSTLLSPHPEYAWVYHEDFIKIIVISWALASLVTDEKRLRLVFLVIVATVGLEAVKQGWLQLLLNPGAQNSNDYIAFGDNNFVAVGMLMVSAMMISLSRTATTRRERLITRFALVGVLYRAISTYSRGGFLALGALTIHYVGRSRRRVVALVAIALLGGVLVPVLPEAFWNRMSTISDAQSDLDEAAEADKSISGRLHFWAVAWEMAKDRPFIGVGHNAYNASYKEYDFSGGFYPGDRSVHNAWLGVLSELGFPGFFLFVTLVLRAFWTTLRTQRLAKKHPELTTLAHFAFGVEGALVVFCVGGSFVIFQYHEILWHMLALSMAIERMTQERLAALTAAPSPAKPVATAATAAVAARGRIMPAPVPLAPRTSRARGA